MQDRHEIDGIIAFNQTLSGGAFAAADAASDSPVFGLLLPSSVRALGLDQLLRDPLQPATFGELLHQRLELTYQLAPILARLHPHTCYEL